MKTILINNLFILLMLLLPLTFSYSMTSPSLSLSPTSVQKEIFHQIARGILACLEIEGSIQDFIDEEERWCRKSDNLTLITQLQSYKAEEYAGGTSEIYKGMMSYVNKRGQSCSLSFQYTFTGEDASIQIMQKLFCVSPQ